MQQFSGTLSKNHLSNRLVAPIVAPFPHDVDFEFFSRFPKLLGDPIGD
jgi:hypothetical protein